MSRSAGAAIALLVVAASAAPARAADKTSALAAHLHHDAALAARVDPAHLEGLVEQYKSSGLAAASRQVFIASAAAVAILGFDPLVEAGWYAAGLDGGAPVLASVARAGNGWHLRVVLAVDDRGKVDRSLARVAGVVPGLAPVTPANAGTLARALGVRDGAALVAVLRKHGAIRAGVIPGLGLGVAVRRAGDVAFVDVVMNADLAQAVSQATRGLGVQAGAARRLAAPGMTLWLHGERAYDELDRLHRTLLGSGIGGDEAICAGFRELVTGGPFVDLALSTEVRDAPPKSRYSARARLGLTWGLRGPYKLAASFLLADDRLADPQHMVRSEGASAAGATYLRTLAPLRSLPRPRILAGSRRDLLWGLANCGPAAPVTGWLMGWPQIAAMMVDNLAAVHADAAALVAGTRNALFGVQRASLDRNKLQAFAEASVEPARAAQVEGYFDSLFGARKPHTGGRGWTGWGTGRLLPYRWDTAGKRPVFGAGMQRSAVGWRMRRHTPSQSKGRLLAELHLHPARLATQLSPELPWLVPLRSLANRVSPIAIHTQFDRDTLESFAVFDLR